MCWRNAGAVTVASSAFTIGAQSSAAAARASSAVAVISSDATSIDVRCALKGFSCSL
jgi:hypothetical protein